MAERLASGSPALGSGAGPRGLRISVSQMIKRGRVYVVTIVCVVTASTTFAETARVLGGSTPLRQEANVASPILTRLQSGARVEVLSQEGEWLRVAHTPPTGRPITGYVLARLVHIETPGESQVQGAASRRPPVPPARRAVNSGFISLNVGYRGVAPDFTSTVTFTKFVEQGTVTSRYGAARGLELDLAVGQQVWRQLGVAVAVSGFRRDESARITARIPHPFFFNRHRVVEGAGNDLRRQEILFHLSAFWTVPLGRNVRVTILGGPSVVSVKQSLVTDLTFAESFPFDTATFGAPISTTVSKTRFGYHAGADLGLFVSKRVGVGALVRFSRASFDFETESGSRVPLETGGLQVGGGVRVRF